MNDCKDPSGSKPGDLSSRGLPCGQVRAGAGRSRQTAQDNTAGISDQTFHPHPFKPSKTPCIEIEMPMICGFCAKLLEFVQVFCPPFKESCKWNRPLPVPSRYYMDY